MARSPSHIECRRTETEILFYVRKGWLIPEWWGRGSHAWAVTAKVMN